MSIVIFGGNESSQTARHPTKRKKLAAAKRLAISCAFIPSGFEYDKKALLRAARRQCCCTSGSENCPDYTDHGPPAEQE
jgi:hypothetical protein